jgi:acetolactate synthase-1/2/3 large subunit
MSAEIADRDASGAELIAAQLAALGVRHVFGVGGANIEDLFLAVQRRRPGLTAVLGKHEHSAGTAADAYARITRSLGVTMTTSGGGAMNLVSALAESYASRVPVLAIVGEPPTALQGRGAFQDTSGRGGAVDAQAVFRAVSTWCERAGSAEDLPQLVQSAARAALAHSAPAVLLVAKDLQQARCTTPAQGDVVSREPLRMPADPEVASDLLVRARVMLQARPIVIIAGDEVGRAGASPDLARLAALVDAKVAVTPDGRDAFDNRDARFLGVTGAMGHPSVARALAEARALLVVGTRLPLLARLGHEAGFQATPMLVIGREMPCVSPPGALHVATGVAGGLRGLVALFQEGPATTRAGAEPAAAAIESTPASNQEAWESGTVVRLLDRLVPEDSIVLVDAGNTGAQAVHHLSAPRRGRWIVAMGMAGMGYTFGAAIGAAFAAGTRVVVLAGDGAFFMHGLDVHTAVEHRLPVTYVIFNNRAHGMCLIRERLLLGRESNYNMFSESHIGHGLAVMFPGLVATDCSTSSELEEALARALALPGPSVVCARLAGVEVPPFAPFRAALTAPSTEAPR